MEFQAPKSSKAHKSLRNAVMNGGCCDVIHLRNLVWLINASADLVGYGQVFEHLLAHLNSPSFKPPALNWASGWKSEIQAWVELCSWIVDNRRKLLALPGLSAFDRFIDGKHPHLGVGVDRHGVPAALWSRHETCPSYPPSENSPDSTGLIYFQLQGHLLASYIDSRFRFSTLAEYEAYDKEPEYPIAPSSTGVVGLAIRDLSHKKYGPLLLQFPTLSSSLDFATQLTSKHIKTSVLPDEIKDDGCRHLDSILLYFSRFLRVIKRKEPLQIDKRGGGGGGVGGHARVHGFIHSIGPEGVYFQEEESPVQDTDIFRPIGQRVLINTDAEDDDDLSSVEESGLAPEEALEEVFQLYTPDELKGKLYAVRYQRLAAEASAQALPFDYSNLTAQELFQINSQANNQITRYIEGDCTDDQARYQAMAGLIVKTMLWLGQTLHEAWALRWRWVSESSLDKRYFSTEKSITLLIRSSVKDDCAHAIAKEFCMPGIRPTYQTELPQNLEKIDRVSTDSFLLPDVCGLGQQIVKYMRRQPSPSTSGYGVPEKTAQNAVKEFCSQFNDRRITPEKIANAMANIIKYQTGDQTLAWVVTADARRANQTRMFYTRFTLNILVNTYIRASRRLAKICGETVIAHPPQPVTSATLPSVGARFSVSLEYLRELLQRLAKQLTRRYQPEMNARDVRRYHLRYQLYVHLYQSIVTAMRAVVAPSALYFAWTENDGNQKQLFASLSDKDSRYTDRARLLVISSNLSKQFANFQLHRKYLPDLLPAISPRLASLGKQHPFFVITSDYKVEPLTPGWLKIALKEITGYDLPVNFARAFIQTELASRGCSAEIRDAHFGHASFGESQYSKMSTYDYRLHFDGLEKHLTEIHDALGLRPIASRLIPHKNRIANL